MSLIDCGVKKDCTNIGHKVCVETSFLPPKYTTV